MRRPSIAATLSVAILLLLSAKSMTAQEPVSHYFTASDGVRIHYLTAGETGSWVVLVHGFTDTARRMWFSTGIATALAENHRIVALDNRNHGESDRPQPSGLGRASDVTELMDHLGIERAHIHGYSMGGAITAALLHEHPERFITAGFGGSGIRETDDALAALAASFDREGPPLEGVAAAAFATLRNRAAANEIDNPGSGGATPTAPGGGLSVFARPIDLTTVTVPVIAINGEFDAPYAKTMRMWRELRTFQNVILPGLNHMTTIMVGGPMPQLYIDSMVGFIAAYDEP